VPFPADPQVSSIARAPTSIVRPSRGSASIRSAQLSFFAFSGLPAGRPRPGLVAGAAVQAVGGGQRANRGQQQAQGQVDARARLFWALPATG
jgi:hypothetical protein